MDGTQAYVDGQPETDRFAWQVIACGSRSKGLDIMETAAYWGRRDTDEDARERIGEITDGSVEIVVTE